MTLVSAVRRRPVALLVLLLVLGGLGIYEGLGLPSAILPSVTFPIVKVIADVGEEPAASMMPAVTRPLEEAMLRVPGIRTVRSTTSRGSSELTAEFAWGTDMKEALQRAQAETERIRSDLPPETRVDVEWMSPATFPIMGYSLTSKTRTQAELRALAEFSLKPALVRIEGVSQVQIQGGRLREFEVWLDPRALAGRGLSAADVVAAVRQNHDVRSAGLTEQNHELYLTLVDGRAESTADLENLSVPVASGTPASLRELGQVRVADEVSYVLTTAGDSPAVLINLLRQPSANTVAIANGVAQALRDQPGLIPSDVSWTTFYDQAAFVTDSVHGTRDAILIGVLLAAVVLLIFLRDLRLTIAAVLAVPVTVALAGLGLALTHQTIDMMTLAGIAAALGLIADDAIVVVENIERHRATGDSDDPVERGVGEILPAVIGSSLSTVVILLPFTLLSGVAGAFFKPLALTMAMTLVASFLVAVLVVPIVVRRLGASPRAESKSGAAAPDAPAPWSGRLLGGYDWILRRCVQGAAPTVVGVALLLGLGVLLYRTIGTDFLPQMDEGSIILDYKTPPGTSLTDTDEMLRQVEKVIGADPDVEVYTRRTGAQLGFFITEPNVGDYVIKLKPRSGRRDIEAIIEDLRVRIAEVEPAVQTDFGQLLEDNIGDLTGGTPQPIDIKVFGDDPVVLARIAREVAAAIATVPGVEDVFDGITIAGPALRIRVEPRALARYGFTTADVHAAVEPAVTGTVAGQVLVGDRLYDLRIFQQHDGPLADLRIRVPGPSGGLIPLNQLASISTGAPEAEINRENLRTFVGVTARLSGRDLGGATADIRRVIAERVTLAPGMSIAYGGLYEQQQQSFRGLLLVLIAGLVLVSIVVVFEFGDWRAPLVTAICALTVLPGVLGALLLAGMTLNVSSFVGAIMMVGIVGENAIFVIHEARLALRRGLGVREAWISASERRLRPVAMTILATAFALAPLALALGNGAQLMQPLAIGVIGGFVLSGPLVLLMLPGLYRALDPRGVLGKV